MDDIESAKQLALNYIDYAPRTRAEVARRLSHAHFEDETIESVLADLERAGLIDDAQFSRDWVESRARRKKLGSRRLASELRLKGVARENVEEALAGLDEEAQTASALELARKRGNLAELEDPATRAAATRRLTAYLQRRGYNWGIIEQVIEKFVAKEE